MSSETAQPKCVDFTCDDCHEQIVNELFLRVPCRGTSISVHTHPNLYRLMSDIICPPCAFRRRLEGQL